MFILFSEIVALTFSYECIGRISSEKTPCTINGTINFKKTIFFYNRKILFRRGHRNRRYLYNSIYINIYIHKHIHVIVYVPLFMVADIHYVHVPPPPVPAVGGIRHTNAAAVR